MYHHFLVEPLRRLYLSGPGLLGFWEGKEFSAICQELTGHSEGFWQEHPDECLRMVDKRFNSYLSTLEIILYFYLLREVYHGSLRFLYWWTCKYFHQDKDDLHRDSVTYIYHGLPNHCLSTPTTIQIPGTTQRSLC